VTAVRPIARFGELLVDGDLVKTFSEKPQIENGWISGGFFVFERKIFDYLDEECMLERKPLEKLAQENQLAVYKHADYWRCMDTYRDLEALNQEWASGRPGWLT
jgi:glucose-1-phosphate cytidylyltransferase